MKSALFLLASLVLVLFITLSAAAVSGDGPAAPPLLKLVVKPDLPVAGGDEIHAVLSDGFEGDKGFLFVGRKLGPTQIRGWDLRLIPDDMIYLGEFPAGGVLKHKYTLPGQLPPGISGKAIHIQGASVGKRPLPRPHLFWAVSNMDGIKFR